MLFAPALTNKLLACCSNDMVSALTLQGGDRHLSAVEAAVKRALPKGLPFVYQESQNIITTANATLRPETIALNVFGGITGIAALLIAGQVISRRVRLRAPDLDIARALGADPPMCLGTASSARSVPCSSVRCSPARLPWVSRHSGHSDRCGRSSRWHFARTGRSSGSAC